MSLDGETHAVASGETRSAPLRVAFYGNVANNFYQLAKALRRWPDMDAHLYIDANEGRQGSPENDDPELENNYPHWIHRMRPVKLREKLFPWRSPMVDELARYDLAVVSAGGPAFANFSGKPVAFFATGYDVTMAPFPIEFSFLYPSVVAKAKALWFGAWQRRGIRLSPELWIADFGPFNDAIRKLDLPASRITSGYCPLIVDTIRFSPEAAAAPSPPAAVAEIKSRFDFAVFHPTRLLMKVPPSMRAVGQWKANDTLIRAFARFVEKSRPSRAGLVFIDRPESVVDAVETVAAKELIRELGIEEYVLWLQPPLRPGFTRAELIAIYSACDVAADSFGAGWFGSVTLEALAMGRPVLCFIDEAAAREAYSWHPLLSSNTVEGNADHLVRLFSDPAFRQERGAASRRWVEEFHSPESAGAVYAQRLREMALRARGGEMSVSV
jgi:glycosyltransferase involved in cell wall biosynthesis